MTVQDLIDFLTELNSPNDELLWADYYYDCREGFIPWKSWKEELPKHIVRPSDTSYNRCYVDKGSVFLIDFYSQP